MTRVLLTGAAGFAGSHCLRHILETTDWTIVCPVTFSHRGVPQRIVSAVDPGKLHRVHVVKADLSAPVGRITAESFGEIDYIVNYASESHVDRSIVDPVGFVSNNVALILQLLEYARQARPKMFVQVSTDEVYGPAPMGYAHQEWDPVIPSNPYSASKAAQEAIAVAYWRTYGIPVVLLNAMNLIGEMQDGEKYLPLVIGRLLRGEVVPVHASPDGIVGARHYIHARNLADAIMFLLDRDVAMHNDGADRPDRFHIVGEVETDNLTLARMVADILGKPLRHELVDFHASRPGHDLRYALDGKKMAGLGWTAPVEFEESLRKTVLWTLEHPAWL